jgi:hypothetical protein
MNCKFKHDDYKGSFGRGSSPQVVDFKDLVSAEGIESASQRKQKDLQSADGTARTRKDAAIRRK